MGDIRTLVASLRAFDRDDVLIKEVRKELRSPVPVVRTRIKATARATLPHHGGLGAWVAGTRITAKVTLSSRRVIVVLRGGRNSSRKRSDIRGIDRGKVRHPRWGHRANWYGQAVREGFFTKTSAESPEWGTAIDRAIAQATRKIHA